jgi:RimJ/RimL family protein N-acetyltransferase
MHLTRPHFGGSATYRFYRSDGGDRPESREFSPKYNWFFWRPSLRTLWPDASCDPSVKFRFLFRTTLHYLGLFSGPECGALCAQCDGRLVHYSAFTPGYWKFPFLEDNDLQIGNTWTDPSHRGRGLARFALLEILRTKHNRGRAFWYVVEETNTASVRVAEKAGFALAGKGAWIRPFGMKLLGSYVMDDIPRAVAATKPIAAAHASKANG